ncbi:hypothetical protein [Glycocaulis alkaliphilus]|uniref:hypothetical protein n=1 Tax=Glycocaulis alkaliphilus TaxID=1434191 RepID=UPI000FD6F38E|nr:hypothetical protein [Glycocaulis alkaliphilus]GGB68608.1 hypothetical protein GCM10007417_05500 [Glycocaulis alkaliphilus]
MSTVCVVGGYQRSGTRQFTDILNQHPDVQISGEIGRYAFVKIDKLISQLRAFHLKHDSVLDAETTARMAVSICALYAKYPKHFQVKGSGAVIGFKTPRAEWQFSKIRNILDVGEANKVFFFCNRDFRDIFLSVYNLGWKADIQSFIDYYKRSLKALVEMSGANGLGDEWAIRILSLDQFLASDSKGEWLRSRVFEPLQLPMSADDALSLFHKTTNRNATVQATGKQRPTALSDADWQYCQQDDELWSLLRELEQLYPGQGFNALEAIR